MLKLLNDTMKFFTDAIEREAKREKCSTCGRQRHIEEGEPYYLDTEKVDNKMMKEEAEGE